MTRQLTILTLFFTLTIYSSVKGQQDTLGTLTILEYGYPPGNDYLNARATVAAKWSIKFKSVAGCIVSNQLVDSVKRHNVVTKAQIIDRHGKDWSTTFENEVEKELEKQRQARTLVYEQPYIIQLDSILGTKGNGLNTWLTPTKSDGLYTAEICGWGEWDGKTDWLKYYQLTIDIIKKEVKVDSDKTEPTDF